MRPAGPEDRDWIEARLRERLLGAMFPLENLRRHGWESDAPRAMRFWVDREAGRLMSATLEGMLMPVATKGAPEAAAPFLAGRETIGVIGDAREVRPLIAALGLGGIDTKLDADEPQFALDLDALTIPEGDGHLARLDEVDRETVVGWRTGYLVETLGEPETSARETAERDVPGYMDRGSHRVLVVDGVPVSMTAVNAALPEIVQIGGVWTPPELRGRGYARRAVALHLKELRAAGVRQATLFASGAAAVRAYEALGFRRTGSFSLVLFSEPTMVPG